MTNRGRLAMRPTQIPARGWADIAWRIYQLNNKENIPLLAAGVAFYGVLAIFPAMAAVVSLYALFADPVDVQTHLQALSGVLPADVLGIFSEQLDALTSVQTTSLGFRLIVGVLLAIWSAHRAVNAIVYAISVAYKEEETRSFFKFNVVTYAIAGGAVLLVVSTLILMVALPVVLEWLPLGALTALATRVFGVLVFIFLVVGSLALLYRFAPPRKPAAWRWISPGSVAASILWLLLSFGFSYYVSTFGNYNETYGALGAVIVLMLWFFLSGYAVIAGAMLNAQMEHQTKTDTTKGPSKPMGKRGATVADELGPEIGDNDAN